MSSTWAVPAEATVPERHPDAPAPGEKIKPHWHGCFGCRPVADGGLGLVATAGDGLWVTGEMAVTPAYEGGPGVIHGGILSTAFDEVMGFAAKQIAVSVVTAHLEVDYAKPIPLGSRLTVHARVEGVLRRKVYIGAEAYLDGAEDAAAAATGGSAAGAGSAANAGAAGRVGAPVGTARGLFILIDQAEHFRDLVAHSDRI